MFNKYLLAALVGAVLLSLVGPAQAYVLPSNYWGHGASPYGPVDNNWNNDSNWGYGIPTTINHARIRSEGDYEEHVTIQTGDAGYCDWLTVGGGIWDEAGVIACLDASLSVEAGGTLYWNCDEEQWGFLELGTGYTGTLHNYGTVDGYTEWPQSEKDKMVTSGPGYAMVPRIFIGYEWLATLGPESGTGVMFAHDGSYTLCGSLLFGSKMNSKGYLYIEEGASVETNFICTLAMLPGADSYAELHLEGGTLDIEDTWNTPEAKRNASLAIGQADGPPPFGEVGGHGVAYLESGVLYVDGDFAVIKGSAVIGKDVDATVNGSYLIRPAAWVSTYGGAAVAQHANANDFLTSVEIDMDPQSGVATHSTVVVGGDTHMDGHMYVENSRDRPKEGDQFTLFDGDAGQTHDGDFLSVTTNLTCGDAGYSVAVADGDWIATFTGLTGGDANADHKVSIGDLSIMAGNWNQTGFTNGYGDADFNCDGGVGIGDLSIMAGNWGWELPGGGVAIPEPATLSLLCLGGLAVIRRRRS